MVPVVAVDEERGPTCHSRKENPGVWRTRAADPGGMKQDFLGNRPGNPRAPTEALSIVRHPEVDSRRRVAPEPWLAPRGVLTDGASPQDPDRARRMARTLVNALA